MTAFDPKRMFVRMRLASKFIPAVSFFVLVGCAPIHLDASATNRIHRVAVISVAAHQFEQTYIGATAFGDEHETHDITAWNIDDDYEKQARVALGKLQRFEIANVEYRRADFSSAFPVYHYPDPYPVWSTNEQREQRLKDLARVNHLDAIIVVLRGSSSDFVTLSGPRGGYVGAGFFARRYAHEIKSFMHFVAGVALIDGQSGRTLAGRGLFREWDETRPSVPIIDVPPSWSRGKFSEFDERTISQIRARLIELPEDAWLPTLKRLFCVGEESRRECEADVTQ